MDDWKEENAAVFNRKVAVVILLAICMLAFFVLWPVMFNFVGRC